MGLSVTPVKPGRGPAHAQIEEWLEGAIAAGARVLSAVERVTSSAEEATLGSGAVYEIRRVRLANGEPIALERNVFPADAFPGLLEEPLEGSLYALMRARGDEVPVRAVERLEPTLARADEANELGVAPGRPLMLVERVAYGPSGRALELSRDLFRGDRTRVVW